jgi:hypothetical protein
VSAAGRDAQPRVEVLVAFKYDLTPEEADDEGAADAALDALWEHLQAVADRWPSYQRQLTLKERGKTVARFDYKAPAGWAH